MATIGRKLREVVKSNGIPAAVETLQEAFREKRVKTADISLREMAESLIGEDWNVKLPQHVERLRESGGAAVDASGFSSITGQLLVDRVKEKHKMATLVTDQLFDIWDITNGNLGTLKVPWLGDVVDEPGVVNQQQEYPKTRFGQQYVELPAPEKWGLICPVTMEMIFSDLTKQAMDSANSVGRRTGLWVEKRRLRALAGIVNPHLWNGTNYNTYLTSGAWINKLTDFTFNNWTDVNRVEQLAAQMLDPVIGEPIDIDIKQVLTVPFMRYKAKRILNATETRSGDITTGDGHQVVAGNPIDTDYTVLASKHLRKLLIAAAAGPTGGAALTSPVADSVTFWGEFKKALVWRQVFPHRATQAPPQHPDDFERDIVLQVKSNVFGAAGVYDPRYIYWCYNSSAA